MATIKAGCYLVDVSSRAIALIHREKQNDYSFPKGHVEDDEDVLTAAIRETAEETKRIAVIVSEFEPHLEEYVTPSGEECACYMFIATDGGNSDNDSTDTHEVVWTPFDEVEKILTYPSLRKSWSEVKENIKKVMDNN